MVSYIKRGTQAKGLKTGSLGEYLGPRVENGKWRRLHDEELRTLYRSPNIFRAIKSRRLRCAGVLARMQKGRNSLKKNSISYSNFKN